MAERSVVVRLRAEVDGFRQGMNTAAQAADRASDRFAGMEKAGKQLALVGAAIMVGVGMAEKAYAEFDEQMSKVQAATHASSGEMAQLREAAIVAGADTAFSAKEAGQAIEELAKAGVSTADILAGGLDGALSLAAAGSLGVGQAAEIAATAMTQFKLSGDKIPHLADLLAAGAGKAQGSVEDLGMALKQGGLVAAQYGLSIEETVGGLAAFASAGLIGSDAGTSLKTMLQRLTPQSEAAAAKMKELGFSAFDAEGKLKPLPLIADNLQKSMKDLTPEARNAAMAIIFGSDAVRAASVLYEQGAEGVQGWINSVNDAGYAAVTASIQQNNLKGDIERLGGSIDSVLLKSGSGLNDMLRGLTRGAEGVVDAIGQIPAPVLNSVGSMTGLIGVVALVGGGLMTLIPKIAATRAAWTAFAAANAGAATALTRLAKGAGVALGAILALQLADTVVASFQDGKGKIEDFNQALLGMNRGDFDKQFQGIMDGVNGAGDAFVRLTVGGIQGADDAFRKMFQSQPIARIQKSVDGLDTSLSALVQNGGLSRAGAAFRIMAEEADKSAKAQGRSCMSAAEVLKLMPSYTAALKDQATAVGYRIQKDEELIELAQGRIPPAMQAAAEANGKAADLQKIQRQASEEQAKALAEVGLAADGTVLSFQKYLDALFSAGNAQLQQQAAARDYVAAFQAVDDSIQKNGTSLDITTEKGRANEAAIDAVAAAGMRQIGAMAANGASHDVLQGKLNGTYDDLIAVAGKFGITGDAADTLARKVLGIPPGVSIQTWMSDQAKIMAEQTTGAINNIPKRTSVYIDTFKTTYEDRVVRSGGNEPSGGGLYGSDQGSANFRQSGGAIYKALGGSLPAYHAAGRMVQFVPNGTDTVPLMATPGEFMIKRSSARSLGYDKLATANATGTWPGASSGPSQFTGNLYLDSGEFLGKVHGVAVDAARGEMDSAARVAAGRR